MSTENWPVEAMKALEKARWDKCCKGEVGILSRDEGAAIIAAHAPKVDVDCPWEGRFEIIRADGPPLYFNQPIGGEIKYMVGANTKSGNTDTIQIISMPLLLFEATYLAAALNTADLDGGAE